MKIDIIGSVASGKTTLAKNISLKYRVPHFEIQKFDRMDLCTG